MRRVTATLVWLLCAGAASAAGLLVVDPTGAIPGSFTSLAPAIAAAGEGDTLLLKSGVHPPVVIQGKSLTLIADLGSDVTVRRVDVTGLAPAQLVELRGVTIESQAGFTLSTQDHQTGIRAHQCAGMVWVEDCRVSGFVRSIEAIDSVMAVVRCEVVGLDAMSLFFGSIVDGGDALWASGSQIVVDRSQLKGGQSRFSKPGDAPAVSGAGAILTGVVAEFAASTIAGADGRDGTQSGFGCVSGTGGGDGLRAIGASDVRTMLTTISGGAGGAPFGSCLGGPPGQDTVVGVSSTLKSQPVAAVRGAEIAAPLRPGDMMPMELVGMPGDAVYLVWGQDADLSPQASLLSLLSSAQHIAMAAVLTAPTLMLSSQIKPLPPGVTCDRLFVQPLHLTPTGVVVLGGPTTLHVVDAP